jgi:diadenosine tetraphosphate (Ap4A) HIT family hydrolase
VNKLSCPMCALNEIEVGELPSRERIFINEHWRALVHKSTLPGWIVVGLRRHALSLDELTDEESLSLGPVLVGGARALVTVVGCVKSYLMLFCEGLPHLHLNLVPRMGDMPPELVGPSVFGYERLGSPLGDSDLDELGLRLASAWARADQGNS